MAEDNTATNDAGTNETDSAKTEAQQETTTSDNSQDFDPTTLSDEQFNKIFTDKRVFSHSRFKELAAKAKRADELEKAHSEAENRTLEEQKKFEELANKYKSENEGLQQKLENLQITNTITAKASQLGIVDIEAAGLLINRSGIKINEDGSVDGVDEALKTLIESKPYLVNKANAKQVGSPSNPNTQTEQGTKKYKLSQIQDHDFYTKNEKDILEAMRLGLIEDDTK